ncbi:hypothetical protein E1B28_005252 [Marasmius oreades]|uniref:Uncharacterized protein n=1 Tax=Marasmius oreades TaxID=181124 RepID=A0A9P7V083_9AGAR|nr:uncharacterized protein E1B28_005252 [Marasmius oreades]KAG7097941.1 hypothetical protein E1B28_005252 [Marasmius oreades]
MNGHLNVREIVPSGITVSDTDLESTDDEIGFEGFRIDGDDGDDAERGASDRQVKNM